MNLCIRNHNVWWSAEKLNILSPQTLCFHCTQSPYNFPHEPWCYSMPWRHCLSSSICCPSGKFLIFLQNPVYFLCYRCTCQLLYPVLFSTVFVVTLKPWGSISSLAVLASQHTRRWGVMDLNLHFVTLLTAIPFGWLQLNCTIKRSKHVITESITWIFFFLYHWLVESITGILSSEHVV